MLDEKKQNFQIGLLVEVRLRFMITDVSERNASNVLGYGIHNPHMVQIMDNSKQF